MMPAAAEERTATKSSRLFRKLNGNAASVILVANVIQKITCLHIIFDTCVSGASAKSRMYCTN